jgi:SAM-dependent methyltransferase/predicted transcriptional regulator
MGALFLTQGSWATISKLSFIASDIMTVDHPTVDANETVLAAVQKLVNSHLSAIPVIDADRKLAGMLTQTDILQLVAQGQNVDAVRNGDATRGYAALGPRDTLENPQDAVLNGVDVAPVVENGILLGVVTPVEVVVEQRLIEVLGQGASNLNREISPNDEMYGGLRGMYLEQGMVALIQIMRALQRAELPSPERILDFPCGHGRVLRFLRAAFSDAELTACDINREGVDFCAAAFNAEAVYSDDDPSKIPLEGRFDLVWVGSLFTHLDRGQWLEFFSFLMDKTAPGGLLVFTTMGPLHSPSLRTLGLRDDQIQEILDDYARDGFGYQIYGWSSDWGLTVCSREFVVSAIEAHPEIRLLDYAPSSWELQNVVACAKS